MNRRWRQGMLRLGAVALLLLCTSCLGAGHATGRLYHFNQSFENKWAQEGMFLVLLPGYLLFSAGDNLIFNPIQWWTGEHPIDPPLRAGPADFGF